MIERRLSESELAELEAMLRDDPEVRSAYLELLGVHRDLSSNVSGVRPFSREELRAVQAIEDCVGGRDEPVSPPPAPAKRLGIGLDRIKYGTLGILLGTAASALIAVTVVATRQGAVDETAAAAQAEANAANHSLVARIVKKIDCDWEVDRWSVAPTSSVSAGQQINLSRGLLVLEFESGVELTLDGPATLIATSDMSAKLLEGKLSARVPPRGRGFTVETHAGDFVDLGTEFGMIVTESGAVETHVFKGEVVAKPTAFGSETQRDLVLRTGVAWTRTSSSERGGKTDAKPELFVRPIAVQGLEDLEAPPVNKALVLWLNAATRLQLDQHRGVSLWGDTLCEGNTSPNDAWQVTEEKRPSWVENGLEGHPTLRFDGYKELVTEPLSLGSDQTSAVVFSVNRDLATELIAQRHQFRYLGVQLLNLNGPPHTVLQVNDDARLEARIHRGWLRDHSDPIDVGYAISRKPLGDGVHVAVYSYDSTNALSQLYVDGELVAESFDTPRINPTNSPRFIGAHFDREGFGFTGDIAEVLIYDAALSAEESQTVSGWLEDKYREGAYGADATKLSRAR